MSVLSHCDSENLAYSGWRCAASARLVLGYVVSIYRIRQLCCPIDDGGLLLFPPETLARLSYTTTLVHNLSIGPLSTDLSGKSFPLTTIVPFKVMHAQVEVPWCRCSSLADWLTALVGFRHRVTVLGRFEWVWKAVGCYPSAFTRTCWLAHRYVRLRRAVSHSVGWSMGYLVLACACELEILINVWFILFCPSLA